MQNALVTCLFGPTDGQGRVQVAELALSEKIKALIAGIHPGFIDCLNLIWPRILLPLPE